MANDLSILITAALDTSSNSVKEINKGIEQLQGKIDKLNLSPIIDNKVISTLTDISNKITQIQNQTKSTKPVTFIDPKFEQQLKDSMVTIDQAIAKVRDLGTIKITNNQINPLTGDVEKFTLAVTKSTGEIDKLKYELASLNGLVIGGQENKLFVPTAASSVNNNDANFLKSIQQQEQAEQNLADQIANLREKSNARILADDKNLQQAQADAAHKNAQLDQDLADQIEKFRLQSIQRVQQEELKWETAQQQAIQKNGDLERQEIAKTEAARQAYADWWTKALTQQEQLQAKMASQDQQKVIDQQDKLTQSLKKMYDQGVLNEQFFTNFNKAINSAQNLEQLDKLEAGLQRVSQYTKNQSLQQGLLSQSQGLLASGKNVDTTGIDNLVNRLNSLNLSEADATRQLSLMQNELKGFSTSATTASEEVVSFGTAMKESLAPLSMYFGGFMLFMQGVNSFKSGIDTLNTLNKSLTTISMITHESQAQVAQLGDQYQKLGDQLSVTTTEIASSATELIRQGLSMDEVNTRLKQITEFSKVAGLSASDATTYITAATNSMRVSVQEATDTFAALGHSSGVNAAYVATAFQKVGGTAGALGLDFQKVASWITTEGERSKESADTIGSSIKSILARVQSLKEKGYDESDGTKINQVAKALATANIAIVDSKGQFLNFGNVIDQLGAKWSSLDSRHKAYIATAVAGKISAA